MKHRLKILLREGWSRLLFHTGLHRAVSRLMPPRLTVLAGHCVDDPEVNGDLPPDMKISRARLERILRFLGRHHELCTVGDGVARLRAGNGRSLVALSMDDGYRDNLRALAPLLREVGAPATVYLETRPLDERRVNWTHKFFWLLDRMGARDLVFEYVERVDDEAPNIRLQQIVAEAERVPYLLKRTLKYESDPAKRDAAIDALFAEQGGDERALCDRLYLTWDDARALRDAGVELGGHTVTHQVLSTLTPERQRQEVTGCRAALERELGAAPASFAYPFGRRWDFDAESAAAARDAGFASATTTHAGTNAATDDPLRLKRLMIDDSAELHRIAAEACGGFDLLRRLGVDLSE